MQTVYSQARDNNPLYSTGNNNNNNNRRPLFNPQANNNLNVNRPRQQSGWQQYLPEITRFANMVSPATQFTRPSTEMMEATFNPNSYRENQNIQSQQQQPDLQNTDELNQISQLSRADQNYLGNSNPVDQETQGILSDLTSNQPQEVTPQQEEEQPQPDTGGNNLPLTSPKPIKELDKEFDQGNVENATNFVGNVMQQNSPQGGMDLANHNSANTKLQSDIQKVAESKDPYKQWKNISNEPFYQDSSFYSGLMGVGLALMSGKSPLEAFQIGTGMSNQEDMKKQLAANRDLLIEQGYSPDSVVNAIAKGDASLLKEKPISLKERLALQDQYSQKKEERGSERWKEQNQILNEQDKEKRKDALSIEREKLKMQLEKSKQLIDYKEYLKQQSMQEKALSSDFDSRTLNSEKNTPDAKLFMTWSGKDYYFNVAKKDLQQAQEAWSRYEKNRNDQTRQEAIAAYTQAQLNLARAEIGENRSLHGDNDMTNFAADKSLVQRKLNDYKMAAGETPTASAINYLRKQVEVGSKSSQEMIKKTKANRMNTVYQTFKSQYGDRIAKKKASDLVNRAWGGLFVDTYGVYGDDDSKENSSGALTSANNSNSNWMYK